MCGPSNDQIDGSSRYCNKSCDMLIQNCAYIAKLVHIVLLSVKLDSSGLLVTAGAFRTVLISVVKSGE